ncbi:hypothetical protein V8E54_004040 [Elaphomyces granulatus]
MIRSSNYFSPPQSPTLVAIAQLSPALENKSERSFHAVVTLVWPFSSSNRTFSLLLAEPDVRLRRHNGQAKVTFHGSCAEMIARTQVGIGDEVWLCLDGVSWSENNEMAKAANDHRGLSWDLHYEHRVSLKIVRNNSCLAKVEFSGSASPNQEMKEGASLVPAPATPTVSQPEIRDSDTQWESPAFLRFPHTQPRTYIKALFDPFAEEDGYVPGKGRKRPRFSIHNHGWRLVDEPVSPTRDGASWEDLDEVDGISDDAEAPEDGLKSVALIEKSIGADARTAGAMPLIVDTDGQRLDSLGPGTPSSIEGTLSSAYAEKGDRPELGFRQPTDTPRLHPLSSPGLPVPSPIVSTSINQHGCFSNFPSVVSQHPLSDQVDSVDTSPVGGATTIPEREASTIVQHAVSSGPLVSADADMAIIVSENVQFEAGFNTLPQTASFPAPSQSDGIPIREDIRERDEYDLPNVGYIKDSKKSTRESRLALDDSDIDDEDMVTSIHGVESYLTDEESSDSNSISDAQGLGSEFGGLEGIEGQHEAEVESEIASIISSERTGDSLFEDSEGDAEEELSEARSEENIDVEETARESGDIFDKHSSEEDGDYRGDYDELASEEDNISEIEDDEQECAPRVESEFNELDCSMRPQMPSHTTIHPEVIVLDSDTDDEASVARQSPPYVKSQQEKETFRFSTPEEMRRGSANSFANYARHKHEENCADSDGGELPEAQLDREKIFESGDADGVRRLLEMRSGSVGHNHVSAELAPDNTQGHPNPISRQSIFNTRVIDMDSKIVEQPSEHAIDPELLRGETGLMYDGSNIKHASEEGHHRERQSLELAKPGDLTLGAENGLVLDGATSPRCHHERPFLPKLQQVPHSPTTQENQLYTHYVDPINLPPTPQATQDTDQLSKTETPIPSELVHLGERVPYEAISPMSDTSTFQLEQIPDCLYPSSLENIKVDGAEDGIETQTVLVDDDYDPLQEHIETETLVKEASILTEPNRYARGPRSRLSSLNDHFNTSVDTISLVVDVSQPLRATSGPRDYYLTLYVTDPSMAGTTLPAQIFRQQKNLLPSAAEGDVILLRNVKVQSFNHSMMLVSTNSSSWAVFCAKHDDVSVNGPPVEYGPEECDYVLSLKTWYDRDGAAMVADHKLQTSIKGDSFEEIPSSSAASSEAGSLEPVSRGVHGRSSLPSTRGSRRGKKQNRRVTIHELRDGRRYAEMSKDSIHELRDGTVYAHSFDA